MNIIWIEFALVLFTLLYIQLNCAVDSDHHPNGKAIPVISVSMNNDPKNYTARMIRSIDYPVTLLAIQIGNSDETIIRSVLQSVELNRYTNTFIENITITCLTHNPGSAGGFNFGLNRLVAGSATEVVNASWVLVVNNDIAFYPGVLRKISKSVERALIHDSQFGLGFTSLCCGGEWSAVAFTRRLVHRVGVFDENFYPAYYEDDDYAIRTHHSGMRAIRIEHTPLLHGEIDGSKDYASGLFIQLYYRPDQSAATVAWRKAHEIGVKHSVQYIENKWGIRTGDFKNLNKLDCKSLDGINSKCVTTFKTPFNDSRHSLSYWVLSPETKLRIESS